MEYLGEYVNGKFVPVAIDEATFEAEVNDKESEKRTNKVIKDDDGGNGDGEVGFDAEMQKSAVQPNSTENIDSPSKRN